jgi:hypothetical protein
MLICLWDIDMLPDEMCMALRVNYPDITKPDIQGEIGMQLASHLSIGTTTA